MHSRILRTSKEMFDRDLNQHAREPARVRSSTRDLRRQESQKTHEGKCAGHSSPSLRTSKEPHDRDLRCDIRVGHL